MSLASKLLTEEMVLSALEQTVIMPVPISPMKREVIDGSAFLPQRKEGECRLQQSQWLCLMKPNFMMLKSTTMTFNGNSPEVQALVDSIKTKLTLLFDSLIYPQG